MAEPLGDADDYVTIGKVLKPRGVHGEAALQSLSDFPERFENLVAVVLEGRDSKRTRIEVERVRVYGHRLAIKFRGIDTPEDVKLLSGSYVTVPREEVHPLPEDTFYVFELVGMKVQTEDGSGLGEVIEVLNLPGNDVYVVDNHGDELLLPAVKEHVRVDLDEGRVVVLNTDLLRK